jgi:hypothetical protein
MGFIYDWCEERLEIQSIADDILAKFVPAHVNIFYCPKEELSTNSCRSFSISTTALISCKFRLVY